MAKSAPSKYHLAAIVKKAKADGWTDLVVESLGRRVMLCGMHPEIGWNKGHIDTVSSHRTTDKAERQASIAQKWLRDAMPGERAPQLAGQVILRIDTGMATSTITISKMNRQGQNNADVFLREALHFGIMRHGVEGMIKLLTDMAEDSKYERFQHAGLRQ